ncbi:MAG: DNA polymerase III, partial [Rhodospirillaceae bacterium]|nr:DNA polymerase III [Rhodospirillales bacterium]
MSTAIPPAPPPAPSSTTGGSGPVSVTVVANAQALAELADGAMIEALAQARATKGVITVQTASGTLELKANAALPPIPAGATLLFQVLNNKDGEATLRLLAINGRPLGGLALGGPALSGVGLPGGPTMAGLLSPGTNPLGVIGNPLAQPDATKVALPGGGGPTAPLGLTATIIRPAMAPGTPFTADAANPAGQPGLLTGGLPPNLPVGTQITVRIAGVNQPQAQAAPGG